MALERKLRVAEVIPVVPESRAARAKLMNATPFWTGQGGPEMRGVVSLEPSVIGGNGVYTLITNSRAFVDALQPGEEGKFVFTYQSAMDGEPHPADSTGVHRYAGYRPAFAFKRLAEWNLVFEAISDGDGEMYVPCEVCAGKRELHNEEGKLVRCARCKGLGVHLSEAEKEDGPPPELPPSTLEMKL